MIVYFSMLKSPGPLGRKALLTSLVFLLLFFQSLCSFAACPPDPSACAEGSNWTSSWTDSFSQTTYSFSGPCKAYPGVPFNVTATVTDATWPNSDVAFPWQIKDTGTTVAGSGIAWITLSGGTWTRTVTRTYATPFTPRTFEFSFNDLGQGPSGHSFGTCVAGGITVDPELPPTSYLSPNINPALKYGWSETSGWINFSPTGGGITVRPTYFWGYAWAENIGWVKLGNDNGGPYLNTGNANWGVNMDAGGSLSGFGWSETSGWINFGAAQGNMQFDSATGELSGYAWAENIGWIHLSNAAPEYGVRTVQHAISLDPGPNGGISCASAAPEGWDVTCSITPLPEYYILSLSDNGSPVTDPTGSYGITGIDGAHTLSASFAEYMVRRVYAGGSAYARTIAEAYGAVASDWETIQLKSYGVFGSIDFDQPKNVNIEGGCGFGFVPAEGATSTIPGNMTVTDGAVSASGVTIQN